MDAAHFENMKCIGYNADYSISYFEADWCDGDTRTRMYSTSQTLPGGYTLTSKWTTDRPVYIEIPQTVLK